MQRAFSTLAPAFWLEWSRLGTVLGQLLLSIDNTALTYGGVLPPCDGLADAAACLLIEEAHARCELRRALEGNHHRHYHDTTVPNQRTAADEAVRLLEGRESYASALPAQLAAILNRSSEDEAWLGAAGEAGRLAPLVHALVSLMGRGLAQLRQWNSDPESFACEVLLPLEDGDDDDDFDEDDAPGGVNAAAAGRGDGHRGLLPYLPACMRAHACACVPAYAHACTCMHACMHACVHTAAGWGR